MKGLILSGGARTRLRPITHTSAKQPAPVADERMLFSGIEETVWSGIAAMVGVNPCETDNIGLGTES